MSSLPATALIIPVLGVGLGIVTWRHRRIQATVAVTMMATLVPVALLLLRETLTVGPVTTQMGAWPAPVGITLVADVLGSLMLSLGSIMGLIVATYALSESSSVAGRRAFYPLLNVLMLGVNGAFLTGDLFNLYVWFEVLLIGSFGLLVIQAGRAGVEAAVKALILNLIGSLLFLVAVGAIYGLAGTLNLADLYLRLPDIHAQNPGAVTMVAALLTLAFALKAALFPLYFWLPASYHVPPAGICALFAALLTKVGVYALLRIFTLPFAGLTELPSAILVMTTVTMISGVLGAVTQFEMKRILAWHSISQVGYIAIGVGLLAHPDPAVRTVGLTAAVFFLLHHGLVKPALFLVAGLVRRETGSTELKPIGGLATTQPFLAGLFLLAGLSLAGIPPLSGFWAKLYVLQAAASAGAWWVLGAGLAAGLLTLLSMLKIWNEVFWKPAPDIPESEESIRMKQQRSSRWSGAALWGPVVALTILISVIGLLPQPLLALSRRAADGLIDPAHYVSAVLGEEETR